MENRFKFRFYHFKDKKMYDVASVSKQFKKIGIYGVTHTFINNKLEE